MKNKATKLKIQIVDDERSINLPSIPFWLINFIISITFGLAKITLRFHKENKSKYGILNSVDSKDIKYIINEFRKYEPFILVDVEDSDKTKVKISTI